ncbi:MAG: 4Fe-4S binding protein [bacterium]|nr:4Fe-4S binding protein [bacterium]
MLLIILIPLFNYYGIKVHQKDETTIGKSVPLSALHLVFKGRDRDKVIAWSHKVKGSVWTIDIFGFKLSDPLAVFESSVVTMYLYWPFILSMAIPLLVTLILGRVYCGWLCPFHFVLEINAKVRRLLEKTGYPTRDIAFSRRTRYIVLAVGLVAAFFFGMPLLSLIYPPAVMSREFFYRIFNSAWGNGFFILLGICFVELILSRRWWCRSVCPGGAVYTALSHRRLLNIERNEHTCDRCGDCNPVCPYALDPMNKQLSRSSQCDNCGLCISSCRPKALKYKFSIKRPAVRHSRGTGKTKSGDRK